MVFCMAPGCTHASKEKTRVGFHRLPLKKRQLLSSWINTMKLKNPPVTVHSRVCSLQFEDDCYERDLKAELKGTAPRRTLKPDAVPSKFDFSKYVKGTVNATTTRASPKKPAVGVPVTAKLGRRERIDARDRRKSLVEIHKVVDSAIEASKQAACSDVAELTDEFEKVPSKTTVATQTEPVAPPQPPKP